MLSAKKSERVSPIRQVRFLPLLFWIRCILTLFLSFLCFAGPVVFQLPVLFFEISAYWIYKNQRRTENPRPTKSRPRVKCSGFNLARGSEFPFETRFTQPYGFARRTSCWLRARSASYQKKERKNIIRMARKIAAKLNAHRLDLRI